MPVLKAEGKSYPTRTQVQSSAPALRHDRALAANERGAEVLILERDAKPTGSTSLSGGQIPAAGTKLQRAAGLMDDTPEILANDIINKAHGECDHEIAWHIARESAKTIDWLVDRYKLPLSCILDFQYPGHSRKHMHASPSRFGAELLAACSPRSRPRASRSRIPPAPPTFTRSGRPHPRVRVTRPDGKTEDIGCEALILACCGYGGDKAMIAKYILKWPMRTTTVTPAIPATP